MMLLHAARGPAGTRRIGTLQKPARAARPTRCDGVGALMLTADPIATRPRSRARCMETLDFVLCSSESPPRKRSMRRLPVHRRFVWLPAFLVALAWLVSTTDASSAPKDAAVTRINDHEVCVGETTIPTRTILWAAGVQASPLAKTLGVNGRSI